MNPCETASSCGDFALVALLGLLGLRIFEATGANITDLGEEHGHRVLRVCVGIAIAFPAIGPRGWRVNSPAPPRA